MTLSTVTFILYNLKFEVYIIGIIDFAVSNYALFL